MKTINLFFLYSALYLFTGVQTCLSQYPFESGRLIPVYPGAILITETDPGDEARCCNFKTNDGFEKVIAFYESFLKFKSLDVNALVTQHPYLKTQADMLQKEMPAGMKIRFFVLKVVEFQGQKGAELFEVYTSPKGVEFSLMESQMGPEDKHYLSEFESAVSGKPAHADPKQLTSVLPPSAPAGYTQEEVVTDQQPGGSVSISTGYRKVIREPKFSESGDDLGIISSIGIGIEEAHKEFYEEMIKPLEGEKPVMIKGKYTGIQRIMKDEGGMYSAETLFVVNNRFLVTITGANLSDPKIISQLIERMNLEALPK